MMNVRLWLLCAALLSSLGAVAARAQAGLAEIVVSAEKREPEAGTPYVTLVKRADNLIVEVRVVCDTRDLNQRRDELKATLRNMIRTAAPGSQIELGLGSEVIGRFDETMLDAVIKPDTKIDTSFAVVVVKTRITPTDTFDSATGRIKAFIEQTPKVGRTEILREEDWSLTIIGPDQYRNQIIAKVADDARTTAGAFGPAYGVSVAGLQKPVDWYQSGPLDLALFIPYQLTVQPLTH